MTRLCSLLLLVLLAACSTTSEDKEGAGRKAAETNTALGTQYLERGQYEIALEKLKRAVAHDKTYAPAHTMLGVLYDTIGETEQAGRAYRTAVKYDPTDGSVNNNYGAFLCATGQQEEAEPYFVTAVEDPFYATPEVALANAGTCALGLGDLDKAERYLRESLGYDDTLEAALLPMAEVSFRQGSYLKARAFLQRYEAVGPATADSLLLGYRIETRLGDGEAAARYRGQLAEQYPNSIQAGAAAGREQE
jgi:type IV pilus assembly protein PilF